MKLLALVLTLVLAACAMSEQDYGTNAQFCSSGSTDPKIRIDACTWLINSAQLQENGIPRAYSNRGNAYARMSQYERAIADHDTAIRLRPDLAGAYNNRGVVYLDNHKYLRAIADFDVAIQLKPDYADAYTNRGGAYLSKRQYDRAIVDLDTAIQLKPGAAMAYVARGATYEMQGKMEPAFRDYRRAYDLGHRPKGLVEKVKLFENLRQRGFFP